MTIMPREAAKFWWNLPLKGVEREPFINSPETAYYIRDERNRKWNIVTWADVHRDRTKRIKTDVKSKRKHEAIKPCIVWVFSNEGSLLFGGTYTMIKTLKDEYYLNFRNKGLHYGYKEKLQLKIMACFPLCLPIPELFDKWMNKFIKKYNNPKFYKPRKFQGVSKCWCKIDENGYLIDIAKDFASLNAI